MGGCACRQANVQPNAVRQALIPPTLSPALSKRINSSTIHAAVILDQVGKYYNFTKVLGTGHFGVVREAMRKDGLGNRKYAIKSIPKENVQGKFQQLKQELEILFRLDHPNIIKLYEIYEDKKYIHMVTETCYGVPLFDKIIEKHGLPEQDVRVIMQQLCSALGHIHSQNIIHRDMRPGNILFVNEHQENDEIKLIDFGLSHVYGQEKMHEKVGTPYYMSPEMLKGQYGTESDIWSLGVTMYAMLSASFPFCADTHKQLFKDIKKGQFNLDDEQWINISEQAKDLIKKLILVNPENRITAIEALQHPWFTAQTRMGQPKVSQKSLLPAMSKLAQYHEPSRLKAIATKILVKHMTADKYKTLRQVFEAIDTTKSGYITAISLKRGMELAGMNLAGEELTQIMNRVDYLKQGKINYIDFLTATIDLKEKLSEHMLFDTFCRFDVEKRGYITKENLCQALKKYNVDATHHEIRNMIDQHDSHHDGKIDYESFRAMMLTEDPKNSGKAAYPRKVDSFSSLASSSPDRAHDFQKTRKILDISTPMHKGPGTVSLQQLFIPLSNSTLTSRVDSNSSSFGLPNNIIRTRHKKRASLVQEVPTDSIENIMQKKRNSLLPERPEQL